MNNQKHVIKISSIIILISIILFVGYKKFYTSQNTLKSFNIKQIKQDKIKENFKIVKYNPVFCKVDDFIKIGVKISSAESQYRATHKGTLFFKGNKQQYLENATICIIDSPEMKHNMEHEKAKYDYAKYMFEHATASKQRSESAITEHGLKELETEMNKTKATYESARVKYQSCTITAPYNCTLIYPILENGTQIVDNQYIFSIASSSKRAQGQIPISLKSMHGVKDGDKIQIIDGNGNIFYTKIKHINDYTNSTQGSLYFESENLQIEPNQYVSNIGTALLYKKQELRCIVPEEHTYHGCSLVMTKDNTIVKRKCFVLHDGRYSIDLYAGEYIIIPESGLNRKNIDDIINADEANIITVDEKHYEHIKDQKDGKDLIFTQEGLIEYQQKHNQDNAIQGAKQ